MLASHGRYPCTPFTSRPDFLWPEGKRLAVYLAVNMDLQEGTCDEPSLSGCVDRPRCRP